MSSRRAVFALLLLVLAAGAERFGYYGARAFLVRDLVETGSTVADARAVMTLIAWLGVLGTLVGAGLAFAVGPRAVAAIGAALAAGACFALALGAPRLLGGAALAFGAGVFRPCLYAAAAEAVTHDDRGPRSFTSLAAFALFAYGAINVASLVAAPTSAALRQIGGAWLSYGMGGAAALFGAACAGALALVAPRRGIDRPVVAPSPGDPYRGVVIRTEPLWPSASTSLAGVAVLAVPHAVTTGAVSISMFSLSALAAEDRATWVYSLNPVVVALATLAGGVAFASLAAQRSSVPPALVIGVGLAIFGVGLAPTLLVGRSVALYALGSVIMAVGEAAMAVSVIYAALALRGRAAALVVAGWLAVGQIASQLGAIFASGVLAQPLVVLSALFCICSGLVLAARARRFHARFFDPAPSSRTP